METGNIIRNWIAYGEGWRVEVRLDASDEAAHERAKNQLRMLVATFGQNSKEFWKEPE